MLRVRLPFPHCRARSGPRPQAIPRAIPRFGRVVALAAALTTSIAGCGSQQDSVTRIAVIGDSRAPFETGARLSPAAQLVRGATVEGLVGFDAQGRIVPGLADRWIVTDDGQSYIFRLRDGTWPDGTPLTGETARQALRSAVGVLRGTALAADLAGIEDIRAMAGRVVEVRLNQPNPDLLQLLAQPELGLARKGKGAGPMALERRERVAVLTPIAPAARGLPAVPEWSERVRPVHLAAYSADKAVARFDAGKADLVLGGTLRDFPLANRTGLARAALRMDAVVGVFGLLVVREEGFLATAANREALAMALDRDGLIAPFGISGWVPTTRMVTPGVEGDSGAVAERWDDLSLAQRQAEAARRVRGWQGARSRPVLRVALPSGTGSDRLFARLVAQLAVAGIDLKRVGESAPADLRLVDQVARYPRATWFLNQLSCAALKGPCSPQADLLVAQARATVEPAGRALLLAEAEGRLTDANVFIPFGAPVRWSLVAGGVAGFSVNRWAYHPLMPLALRTK